MKTFNELLEDIYASQYKIKKVQSQNPTTGDWEWHDRKVRTKRIDFKNSKMGGKPSQEDEDMKEESTPYWKKPSFNKRMSQMAKQERREREQKEAEKKTVKEENMTIDEQINEVLSKDATAGDWIHDFVHSDNPKFEGKSKEKRKQMALAAYYAKQQNEEVELEEGDLSVRTLYNKFADAHVNGHDTKSTEKAIKKVHGDEVLKHMKKAANANAKGDMDKEENHFDNAQNAARKTDRIGGTVGRGRSEFMRKRREWSEEVELEEGMYSSDVERAFPNGKASGVKTYAPVAPVPDKKYIKGTPENKALRASRKPINGHPTNVKEGTMKSFKEMMQSLDEKSDQAKQNKTMKNMMDASRGARYKVQNKVTADEVRDWDGKHPTPRAQNVAIGRALRNEEKKDDVPFDGPYTKSPGNVKDKSGAVHTPMSRARDLARQAMKKQMKEEIDVILEATDSHEYADGEMSIHELKQIKAHSEWILEMLKPDTDMPEWVQAKITLAADYLSTACDYLHVEMNEELKGGQKKLDKNHNGKLDSADFKMLRGEECPECHKAPCECDSMKEDTYPGLEKMKKMGLPTAARSSHPRGVNIDTVEGWDHPHDAVKKKEVKEESDVQTRSLSFSDFMSQLNEYTPGPGGVTRVQGRSYGAQYRDPEGEDDADEKKKQVAKPEPAVKRGRGRPAGSKSGANQKVTSGTKRTGVDYTGYKLHLPNTNR